MVDEERWAHLESRLNQIETRLQLMEASQTKVRVDVEFVEKQVIEHIASEKMFWEEQRKANAVNTETHSRIVETMNSFHNSASTEQAALRTSVRYLIAIGGATLILLAGLLIDLVRSGRLH